MGAHYPIPLAKSTSFAYPLSYGGQKPVAKLYHEADAYFTVSVYRFAPDEEAPKFVKIKSLVVFE